MIINNPCKKSVKSDMGKFSDKKEALTIDVQRKFLEESVGQSYEYQYRFILQTGLRTGELVGLRWEDIDFENRAVTISRTMKWKDSVFFSRKGEPVKIALMITALFKICDKIGIKRFSMHVLRHTFVTRCIETGALPKLRCLKNQ